jgi:hypothetical protein
MTNGASWFRILTHNMLALEPELELVANFLRQTRSDLNLTGIEIPLKTTGTRGVQI